MASPATDDVLAPFDVHHLTYKTLSSHAIQASLLISKTLRPGRHPLAINLHGGFLAAASRLYTPFLPRWLLHIAQTHNAIILSADYTLLPSRRGLPDINADLADLWAWTRAQLGAELAAWKPGFELDLGRTMLVGGSAGGYAATQLALSHPEEVRLLAAFYPMLHLDAPFWREGPAADAPTPFCMPREMIASREATLGLIEGWERDAAAGKIVTEGGEDRLGFAIAFVFNGLSWRVFDPKGEVGADELPLERVKRGERLPAKVWVTHGTKDSAVPLGGNEVFVEEARKLGGSEVVFDVVEGADHGFDAEWDMESEAIQEKIKWVAEGWLGGQ